VANLNHYDELIEVVRLLVGRWENDLLTRQDWDRARALLKRLPNQEKARIPDYDELVKK
jgi:uncharacterized protein YqgQ